MLWSVDDGAFIINMSTQWIDNGQCGTPGTIATIKKVEENNAILRRAIEYALSVGRDVLWVMAAGNECRDARFSSPASLGQAFPDNVLVVAAIDVSGGLAQYSDFGDIVSVAAPGSDILSTMPGNERGMRSGTSMATPHVSSHRFKVVDAYQAVMCQ